MRPTVKIGLVAPFEGRYRYVGYDVIYAVRLALQQANAVGGIGGYSVELVAYDDGADPAQATEQARKLDVDPQVVGVIGHFRDETTHAALSTYKQAGLPLVVPGALDPALTDAGGPAYRLGPPVKALADAILRRLGGIGASRAALITDGGPLGQAVARRAATQSLTLVILDPSVSSSWLQSILSGGADAIVCDLPPVAAGEATRTLRDAAWNGPIVGGPDLASTDFVAVAADAAAGTAYVTPWPDPAEVPGAEDFAAAYGEVSNGLVPGPLALPAYEATWVLIEAIGRDLAAHGSPSRTGVAQALVATDREGLLGRITFDAAHAWSEAQLYTVERP